MTELEQAREQKAELYRRLKEANAAFLDAADAAERIRQRERARMLKEMYQEACERVRRLDPERTRPAPPKGKKGRKPASTVDSALACGAIWADLEGTAWARVEGRSWNDLPGAATGRQMKQIQELVGAAMAMCTPLQSAYLHAYYAEELTLEEIGERFGVDVSTVSRTLKRGRGRIEQYVKAKLLLGRCVDETGRFDYMKFLNSAGILTERQKEMVYLLLARDTSCRDIAGYIGRTPSTVSRTAERVEDKLGGLAVTVDAGWSAVRVERKDWTGRSEKKLAEDLGLSPAFYYRVMRRGERSGGVPLLYCAILNRLAAGHSVEQTAKALGCSKPLVKRVRRAYRDAPAPAFREDYRPSPPKKERLPDNPFVLLGGGDAIIDRIDAATYQALQERFGGDTRGPRKTKWFCGERTNPGTTAQPSAASPPYGCGVPPAGSEPSRLREGEGCGGGEDNAGP